MKIAKTKKILAHVTEELIEGKKIVKKEKKRLKMARGKLAKNNEKRALKVVKDAVDNLEDHRELLKDQLSSKKTRHEAKLEASDSVKPKRKIPR